MTLSDAAKAGVTRVRRPMWGNDNTYARIDIVGDGNAGPWLHLYDRQMQEAIGEPTPQTVACIEDTTDDYVEYTGELDPADVAA